ncbi:MAG: HD domain-containing protein [Thermoguttaceae bacterium]
MIPAVPRTETTMPPSDLIDRTANHVKAVLSGDGTGHDWWHVYRVWKMAKRIGQAEGAGLLVVELAALLHDIADWKLHDGDCAVGPRMARDWLDSLELDGSISQHVCQIIADISFKGAGVEQPVLSLEGQVVQDADRLDAIGAIGIARAFSYGGAKGRLMYDPVVKPTEHRTAEAYLKSGGTTINHFYEKLLLLKDRMNTATGKAVAEERHRFIEEFLERFFEEWEGG